MHATRHSPPLPRHDVAGRLLPTAGDTAPQRYQQARDAYLAADYDRALHVLYPLLKALPLDVSVNKLVGYAHFAREDYALALVPLSAATLFTPDDPEPMLISAQCLAKLGDGALARDLAMQALETSRQNAAHADIGARAERFLATI
jgi:Flp pilus assembly protein TadD